MRIAIRDDRPPVSPEALAAAEERLAELGHHIPPSYKAFLAEQDGGKPVRNSFSFRQHDRDQDDLVRLFYGIAESPNGDLVERTETAGPSLPPGVLPIATDAFGNLVVIDGRNGGDGPVLFWDHEFETDPPDESNLFWVAPDLETFLANLTEDTDPAPSPQVERSKGWRRIFDRG
jgi:cell wall assembly regulator SMI1